MTTKASLADELQLLGPAVQASPWPGHEWVDVFGVMAMLNATRAALESVALQVLADHTEHCVAEAIRSGGGSKKVKELNEAVERLVRS